MIGICSTEAIAVESLPNYEEYEYKVVYPKTSKTLVFFLKGLGTQASCTKVYIDKTFENDETLIDKIALIHEKVEYFEGTADLMLRLQGFCKQDANSMLNVDDLNMDSLIDEAVKGATEQLSATNVTLETENNILNAQIVDLTAALEKTKVENQRLITEKAELDQRCSTLTTKFDSQTARLTELEEQYKLMTDNLSVGTTGDVVELPGEDIGFTGDDSALIQELQEQNDMLQLQLARFSALEQEADENNQAYEELTEAYNKVEREKDNLLEQINALERKVQNYELQLNNISNAQSDDASRVSELNFEIAQLREQNKELTDSLAEKGVQLSDLSDKLSNAEKAKEQLVNVENLLNVVRQEKEIVSEQYARLMETVQVMKNDASESLTRITQLEEEKRSLSQQVQNSNNMLSEMQAQHVETDIANRRLNEDIENLRNQLTDAKEKVVELQNQTLQIEVERDNALDQVGAMQSKINDLDEQLNQSLNNQVEVNSLKAELEKARAEAKAGTEFTQLQLQYDSLQKKYEELENSTAEKLHKMQTDIHDLTQQKASLEGRIKSMQQGGGGYSPLGKFDNYALNPFTPFAERLSMGEQGRINGLDLSNISVCAMGEGASVAFLTEFTYAWETFPKHTLVVDLTNNKICFTGIPSEVRKSMDKEKSKAFGVLSAEGMIPVKPNIHMYTNDKFNDLSLLTMDYGEFLAELSQLSYGQPVMIILGNLSSFANRVAFVKLASVCKSYVFLHALSLAMLDTVSELKQISHLLTNCTALVLHSTMRVQGGNNTAPVLNNSSQTIIKALANFVKVHVVPGAIDWVQLGII